MFTSFKSIVATYVHTIIIIILYLQLLPIYNVIYVVYCLVPDPTGLGTYWYGLYTRRGSSKPQPTLALCCQVTDASCQPHSQKSMSKVFQLDAYFS